MCPYFALTIEGPTEAFVNLNYIFLEVQLKISGFSIYLSYILTTLSYFSWLLILLLCIQDEFCTTIYYFITSLFNCVQSRIYSNLLKLKINDFFTNAHSNPIYNGQVLGAT